MFKVVVNHPLEITYDSNERAGVEVPVRTIQSNNVRLYRQEQSLAVDSESGPTVISQTVVALALPVSFEITKLFLVHKVGIPQFKPPKLVTFIQEQSPIKDKGTIDVQMVVFDFHSTDDAKRFYDNNHSRWLEEGRYQSLCLKLVFSFPLEDEPSDSRAVNNASPSSPRISFAPSASTPSPPPLPPMVRRSSASPPLAAAEEEQSSLLDIPGHSELIELPKCAVCLDRLDPSIAGVGPGVCMHQFMTLELSAELSCDCWRVVDRTKCRVCSILNQCSPSETSITCEVCEIKDRLWTCLVCGYVGCGRYTAEHSLKHYFSSGHRWALDLTNRRIWDYSEDNYAHRLPGGGFGVMGLSPFHLQSSQTSSLGSDFKGNSLNYGPMMGAAHGMFPSYWHQGKLPLDDAAGGGGGGGGGLDKPKKVIGYGDEGVQDIMSSDVSKSGKLGQCSYFDAGDYGDQEDVAKLGGLAREYEQLLMAQLSEQRRYYEQLLTKELARIASENELIDEEALEEEKIAITQVKDSIEELEKELKEGMEHLRSAEMELRHARKEQVRLLAQQQEKERQVREIKSQTSKEQKSCEEQVKELQATITELTFFHRTREEISQSPNKEEIRSGHVLVGEGLSTQSSGKEKTRNRRNGRR